MISPFKFLDSYTRDDRAIFFGRDHEIEELYQKIFESKILIVYGVSGTGKSSLIQCGLAGKFSDSDWLPVNIRRGSNLVESMANAVHSASLTEININTTKKSWLNKSLRSLYLDHFKPVYLIFDQFEELFIFGNKAEKEDFISLVKSVTESDLQVHFLFVIREEYLAGITEFEKQISGILANRVRIEKMTHANAQQAIEGPCKFAGIEVEQGFSELLLEKLAPEGKEIELTYLQVYLDKIYRSQSSLRADAKQSSSSFDKDSFTRQSGLGMTFSSDILEKLGEVKDLLGSFLEEQISQLSDPGTALVVLKSFVSTKGTKRQVTEEDVLEYSQTLGKNISKDALRELILRFVTLRILRDKDESGRYELRHDALASKIYEKITLVEKELLEVRQFIENAFDNFQRRKVFLSASDLSYIAPYENKMYLNQQLSEFVLQSKKKITLANRRKRNILIAAAVLFVVILGITSVYFYKAQKEAELQAKIEKSKSIAKSALSIVEKDPTLAYLLAEYAYKLYPTVEAESAILNSYKNAPLCTKIICDQFVVSDDKKWIAAVSTFDNIIRVYNYKGVLHSECIGHKGHIEYDNMRFSKDSKYLFSNSISDSTERIWDIEGNQVFIYKTSKSSQYSPLELVNNNIIVLEKDKVILFDLSGKKRNEIRLSAPYSSFRFKDGLLAVITKNLEASVYDLKSLKLISKIILDKKYQVENFSDNNNVVLLSKYIQKTDEINDVFFTRSRSYNISYNLLWNLNNNTFKKFDIDTLSQFENKLILFGNKLIECIRTNKGISSKIMDISGKIIKQFPLGYDLWDYWHTQDKTKHIIFKGNNSFIDYNIANNKSSLPYKGTIIRERDNIAIIREKGDPNTVIKAINLDNNRIIKEIKVDTRANINYNIDFIPYLNVFVYLDKYYKLVFENLSGKNYKTIDNTEYNLNNKQLLFNNYYLMESLDISLQRINSLYIWKIDTAKFSTFDLSSIYYEDTILVKDPETGNIVKQRIERALDLGKMGYSPDEKYIITSERVQKTTCIWDKLGNKIKEIPFYSAVYKFSKSGKYVALNSFNQNAQDTIKGEFRLYSFPEFKLLYSEPSFLAGIDFIESSDTLCVLYAGNSIKYINMDYKKQNEWRLNYIEPEECYFSRSYDWLSLKGNYLLLLNTTFINDNYFNRKVEVYDYLKRDTLVFFKEDSSLMINLNRNWNHTLFTSNRNVIINLKKSIQIKNFKNNIIFNLKNKGDFMCQEPYNDSIILVFYLFANEYRMAETPDTFQICYRRTPNYFIEMWDIYNNKMIYQKRMSGTCENFSFNNERMLMNYGSKYLYTDIKCNKIIEFQGNDKRSDISPKGNYFIYFDYMNKRLVNFPLNPKEIIRRVRIEKEFGEIGQLTDDEKQEYGIE